MRFGGLDNRHDPAAVGADGLVVASNINHRDNSGISLRDGFTVTSLTGSALHSLWGAADGSFGYVADGSTLKYLNASLQPTTVGSMPSSNPIGFVETPTWVAAITASGTRFLSGTAFVTPSLPATLDDETQFKALATTLTGTTGVYHYGRLYIFGDVIKYTAAYNIGVYDTRDYQLPVGFTPRCGFSTNNGIWVGGDSQSIFLEGTSPADFEYNDMMNFGIHAGVQANPLDFGQDGSQICYLVSTTRGAFLLSNDGVATSLSKEKYYPPVGSGHKSLYRYVNGTKQLLTCFTYSADGESYTTQNYTVDSQEDPAYVITDNALSATITTFAPTYTTVP